MQQQGGITAVVQNHVGITAIRPFKNAVCVVPIFSQVFAFDREYRRATGCNRRRSVILGRKYIARCPANLGAQRIQRFDQHSRLDGHMQAAGDARAFQRLGLGEFLADRHQAGHFNFSDSDFFAAPRGQVDVSNDVVFTHKALHS